MSHSVMIGKRLSLALLCTVTPCFIGCGRPTVVRSVTSDDRRWVAELVAVRGFLGTYDAELRLMSEGKKVSRQFLFGGRDALQDIEQEIFGLRFSSNRVEVTTRGNFGPKTVEHLFPR